MVLRVEGHGQDRGAHIPASIGDRWLEWVARCKRCGVILRKQDPLEVVVCGCGWIWGDDTRKAD